MRPFGFFSLAVGILCLGSAGRFAHPAIPVVAGLWLLAAGLIVLSQASGKDRTDGR